MTQNTDDSLSEKSRELRGKLQAQRELITQRTEPAHGVSSGFPRSMTMRFLIRRRALLGRLLLELFTLLVGARILKSVSAGLFLARLLLTVPALQSGGHSSNAPRLPAPALPDKSNLAG